MVENERLKINVGQTKEGTVAYSIVLKKARTAIYLGTIEKITLIRLLEDVVETSKKFPQAISQGIWVAFGQGELWVWLTLKDAAFILENIPLTEEEKQLALDIEESGGKITIQ